MVLPQPVPEYKFNFGMQDHLDSLFASLDVNTVCKTKEARLHEIYFFFGVVNSYTMYMEMKAHYDFKDNRLKYKQAVLDHPYMLPARSCPIRQVFVRQVRDMFFAANPSDWWLMQHDCSN